MEHLIEYLVFLAQVATLGGIIVLVVSGIMAAGARTRKQASKGTISVTHLNREIDQMRDVLRKSVYDRFRFKRWQKQEKKRRKTQEQQSKQQARDSEQAGEAARDKRVYVLNFKGDLAASRVECLRQEITTVLSLATEQDEVVLRLESPGGMVHAYGLASSQLQRIKDQNVPLTICVDKVAASGGYMMACLADRLVAAPFAMIGSIGVLMQVPNFHRLLKNHDIDYEMITAGEFKRTLTVFGEITQKGRNKAQEDVEEMHQLFKDWVKRHRDVVDIDNVATGETWVGLQARERNMVDAISTSDDYIVDACENADVYEISYEFRRGLGDKLGKVVEHGFEGAVMKAWQRLRESRYMS